MDFSYKGVIAAQIPIMRVEFDPQYLHPFGHGQCEKSSNGIRQALHSHRGEVACLWHRFVEYELEDSDREQQSECDTSTRAVRVETTE